MDIEKLVALALLALVVMASQGINPLAGIESAIENWLQSAVSPW
jgi:hypothetical protein